MKRFIKHLLIFTLPLVIIGIFFEVLLRKIPNDYQYKKEYLDKNAKNIKILFLGSSHIFRGINPVYIKSNSFNAANISQSIDYDHAIIEKYKNNLDSLKYIVIAVDYQTLFTRLETGIENWRAKNYAIYFNISIGNPFKYQTEIFTNKTEINFQRFYDFYINHRSNISCNELGWGPNKSFTGKIDLEADGKKAAKRHLEKVKNYFTENTEILKQMLELAKTKKWKVMLISAPAYNTYVQNLNSAQLNKTYRTITNLMNSYPYVTYIDFLKDKSFEKEDFFDADHLNEYGAKKFTLKIANAIDSIENRELYK